MLEVLVIAGLLLGAILLFAIQYRKRLRRIAIERMSPELDTYPDEDEDSPVEVRSALRRFVWLPVVIGVGVAALLHFSVGINWMFSMLFGLILVVLGAQLEGFLAARRDLQVEAQLADAIDLIVGALRSGAGLVDALDAAVRESRRPIQPILQEMVSRLRLGDDPVEVFNDFAYRVPLETFRLFSFSLSVHWEIGGSLAPALSTVGRTIRDRIDLARRVRSQTTQARASVVAILIITYALTFIVWRTNPERLEAFVSTQIGQGLIAATIFLQLVGLVWMSKLSSIRY